MGSLASGVAHDLNNILAPILMSVSLLKEKLRDDKPAHLMLDLVEASVNRGRSVVRQILLFARGTDNVHVPLQSRHLLREVADVLEQTLPKSVVIEGSFPPDLPLIAGDATQLYQVFINLGVNARDAMPDGGVLSITGKSVKLDELAVRELPGAAPGEYVAWTVADTGTGIAPENLSRLFDPFFTTKELGKGTGLGLATVDGIVRSHRGFVRVQSTLGAGTSFEVLLPAAEGSGDRAASAAPMVPDGQDELVMLVDDEFSIRRLVEEVLLRHHYRVISAGSGVDAIEQFREKQAEIALLITDLAMPGMSGEELIGLMRSLKPDLKVIAISGYVEVAATGATHAEVIADAFLPKPFDVSKLLSVIHEVLASGRRR